MPVPPRPDRERSIYDDRVRPAKRVRTPVVVVSDPRPLRVKMNGSTMGQR
jgi:hypothetical protein